MPSLHLDIGKGLIKMKIKYTNKKYIIILVTIFTIPILCMIPSCTLLSGTGDPDAKSEGYKLYTGREEGFRLSSEYSENWQRDTVNINDPNSKMVAISFNIPRLYSTVTIASDVNKANGGHYIDANEYIDDDFSIFSQRPEFKLIERKNTFLGSIMSEEIIYSYRFYISLGGDGMDDIDRINLMRMIATDYKGRIYSINLYSTPLEYDNIKNDFEHLVINFKFKD
jgi:hypothetical protein